MSLTLEQARMDAAYTATWAYAFTTATAGGRTPKPRECKMWKTQLMGFGTNVHRCGLIQALAFLRRDEPGVYDAVAGKLRSHLRDRGFVTMADADDLLEVVRKLPSLDYMLVSREVLGVALWLKRAAQILCADAPTPGAGGAPHA